MRADDAEYYAEVLMLRADLEEMTEARQRDRKHLLRCGKLIKEWIDNYRHARAGYVRCSDSTLRESIRWLDEAEAHHRTRDRCKRAGKLAKANETKWLKTASRLSKQEQRTWDLHIELEQVREKGQRDRKRSKMQLKLRRDAEHTVKMLVEVRKETEAERDELRRQLKEVSDCIVHYAPTDFPILKYDSVAEALVGLLEGEDADEPNKSK